MAKKQVIEGIEEGILIQEDFGLEEFQIETLKEREVPIVNEPIETKEKFKEKKKEDFVVSCLRNERIIVRHIPKQNGMIINPKHVLYGGMSESATRSFSVPTLQSGQYINVLTDSEKSFLEEIMGLEYNALSVYKKVDNFWLNVKVRLTKQDTYLDLSNPDEYIKYKVLLAWKDIIAPNLKILEDYPKATYQFVLISEGEENKTANDNMTVTMKCYKEFGKIENNIHLLRAVVETIDGRPTSPKIKVEELTPKINDLIQAKPKFFLDVITDPLLPTKALIKRAIEAAIISKRSNLLYLKSDNSPLCEYGEESTINVAAKYLNAPKHQELKFSIEAKLKE